MSRKRTKTQSDTIGETIDDVDAELTGESSDGSAGPTDAAVAGGPLTTDAPLDPVVTPASDDAPAPDATNNAGADLAPEPVATADAPPPLTIGDVLADLAGHDGSHGRLNRYPTPKLTHKQALTQSHLADLLTDRGLLVKRQHDVYGWLLDQVAASAGGDE